MACFKFLSTDKAVEDVNDAAWTSSEPLRKHINKFITAIEKMYQHVYLSRPNQEELQSIADSYAQTGFPGCVGAIDCY